MASSENASANSSTSVAKTWLKQYFDDSNFPEWTRSQPGITTPLMLPERDVSSPFGTERETDCLFCEEKYLVPKNEKQFLFHLMNDHNFVIGDVNMISDLPTYIRYWKNKFSIQPLTHYCAVIQKKLVSGVKEGDEMEMQNFYFLSDALQEDRELRINLQMRKLQYVLDLQERERNDITFERGCLFCRSVFCGSSTKLFNHMALDHNFSVGLPENLVYINELLDLLKEKMENMICIYCEKVFKSREILKEHMRKKNHKKINPANVTYDKFYIVNYLEFGKSWEQVSQERDGGVTVDDTPCGFDEDDFSDENEWSDWRGDLSGAVCLFCSAIYTDVQDLYNHMSVVHKFDYPAMKRDFKLTFYQQVKLVNYIRRQMHLKRCIHCLEDFLRFGDDADQVLSKHMQTEGHMKPPSCRKEWDHSQYFFPTYENDNLLFCLEEDAVLDDDVDESGSLDTSSEREAPVIPEELNVRNSILVNEEIREMLRPRSKHGKQRIKETGKSFS